MIGGKKKSIKRKSKKNKKEFFFNPNNPKKSYDVYIDKNPSDTISIKYKTLEFDLKSLYGFKNFRNSIKYREQ